MHRANISKTDSTENMSSLKFVRGDIVLLHNGGSACIWKEVKGKRAYIVRDATGNTKQVLVDDIRGLSEIAYRNYKAGDVITHNFRKGIIISQQEPNVYTIHFGKGKQETRSVLEISSLSIFRRGDVVKNESGLLGVVWETQGEIVTVATCEKSHLRVRSYSLQLADVPQERLSRNRHMIWGHKQVRVLRQEDVNIYSILEEDTNKVYSGIPITCLVPSSLDSFRVGDAVGVVLRDSSQKRFFHAIVESVIARNHTCLVRFSYNRHETAIVSFKHMISLLPRVGEAIIGKWRNRHWCAGIVTAVFPDGRYEVCGENGKTFETTEIKRYPYRTDSYQVGEAVQVCESWYKRNTWIRNDVVVREYGNHIYDLGSRLRVPATALLKPTQHTREEVDLVILGEPFECRDDDQDIRKIPLRAVDYRYEDYLRKIFQKRHLLKRDHELMQDVVEVRRSIIHGAGLGLFAKKHIRKNQFLGVYLGRVLTSLDYDQMANTKSSYVFFVQDEGVRNDVTGEKGLQLDAANVEGNNLLKYVNDFRPNHTQTMQFITMDDLLIVGRATRDITPGQEIFGDYGEEYWDVETIPRHTVHSILRVLYFNTSPSSEGNLRDYLTDEIRTMRYLPVCMHVIVRAAFSRVLHKGVWLLAAHLPDANALFDEDVHFIPQFLMICVCFSPYPAVIQAAIRRMQSSRAKYMTTIVDNPSSLYLNPSGKPCFLEMQTSTNKHAIQTLQTRH